MATPTAKTSPDRPRRIPKNDRREKTVTIPFWVRGSYRGDEYPDEIRKWYPDESSGIFREVVMETDQENKVSMRDNPPCDPRNLIGIESAKSIWKRCLNDGVSLMESYIEEVGEDRLSASFLREVRDGKSPRVLVEAHEEYEVT
jgi:hypothetical protein